MFIFKILIKIYLLLLFKVLKFKKLVMFLKLIIYFLIE